MSAVASSRLAGAGTLFRKEVLRFWKVSFQTVGAPVLTAVLYLLIFGHVLQDHVKVYDRIDYISFLVPGLVMMSVLQNAFANSSSSLIQSKIMGSLVFVLLTPLSHRAWFAAYVGSSVLRGLAVGLGVFLVTLAFAGGLAVYGLLHRSMGLRLEDEAEYNGADLSLHRISATPERETPW